MNPPQYTISVPYERGRALEVEYSTRHGREKHPDRAVEAAIDTEWTERTAANAALFNASKFRLSSAVLTSSAATLRLGLTDYKTYLGTHFQRAVTEPRFRARPLGNVVVATTDDGCIPLIVRCARVADAPGMVALPGGHAEPDAVHWPVAAGAGETDAAVLREVVDGARREVLEELFVGSECVSAAHEFEFLGVVERQPDGKPTVAFAARLHVSGGELRAAYEHGNVAKEESDGLLLLSVGEMLRFCGPAETHPVAGGVPELLGAAELLRQKAAVGRALC